MCPEDSKPEQWWAVRMLARCDVDGAPHGFEDRIVVLRAESHFEAEEKADQMAAAYESNTVNIYGETVRWVVERIVDLRRVVDDITDEKGRLIDGAEVWWAWVGEDWADRLRIDVVEYERELFLSEEPDDGSID